MVRCLAYELVERVLVGVGVQSQDEIRIRAHRKAQVGRKIGHLPEQACIEKDQVPLVADPEIAITAWRRHEEAGPARRAVPNPGDGVDNAPVKRKEEKVLEAWG